MNLKDLMGFIFSITLLLPIILIIALRLYRMKSFIALGIYYSLTFFDMMMMQKFMPADESFRRIYGVTINLLDVPLMLTFLVYFNPSLRLSKQMKYLSLVFIVFEIIVTLLMGYNRNALTIIIGPGLFIILFFCAMFFIRQIKIAITLRKGIGKAIMISSFLFVFGCYSFIYVMHYIIRTPDTADVYIMYLISSALSSILVFAGLMIESQRICKLQELLVTRHELSQVYKKEI